MARKSRRGTRYTAAQKAEILATAKKEGLTGAQVAKRFGVSTLTFYRWRGPVRSDALASRGEKRGPGRPKGSTKRATSRTDVGSGLVRDQVREEVRRVLPQVIRQEIAAYLARVLGR